MAAIGHSAETQTLRVQFKSKNPDKPGSVYDYAGVTEDEYIAFLKAESIGRHFGTEIKNNPTKYPYTKIS